MNLSKTNSMVKGNSSKKRKDGDSDLNYMRKKAIGKIKFFDFKKGYGFFVSSEIEEDNFCPDTLFTFDVIKGPRGLHAKNVYCLNDSNENEKSKILETECYNRLKQIVENIVREEILLRKSKEEKKT